MINTIETHLTAEKARQMALMLASGMPPEHAMAYFLPEMEEVDRNRVMHRWLPSKALQDEIKRLQGKSWGEMSLQERIQTAIDKHYTEAAYFLYVNNYATLEGAKKQKADTCRQVLEAKLAGMAGKMEPMQAFLDDLLAGRVRAVKPRPIPPPVTGPES